MKRNDRNKNLTSKTLYGFKWSYIGVFFQVFIQLIVVSILSRLVPPEDFGLISIAFIFINVVQLISQIGIGPALIQRKEISDKHISSAFIFSIALGVIIYVIFYVFSPDISRFFGNSLLEKIIKVIGFTFIVQSLFITQFSLLQKELKFKEITFIKIISYFFGYGMVGIVLALMGYGVWALVFATLSQSVIRLFLTIYYKPIKLKTGFYKKEFMELLHFGGGFTIGRVFNYVALNGDNFIIGKVQGSYYLGIYSRVYTIISLPAIYFTSVFDKVLFPAISQIQTEKKKIKEIFLNGSEFLFFIGITLAIFFYKFSDYIVLVLLGNNWREAIPVLQILSWGIPFRASYKLSDSVSRSLGAVYGRAWRQGVYAFLILTGAYFGGFYGLRVVAMMIVFALITIYILMLSLSCKILNIGIKEIFKAHLLSFLYIPYLLLINFLSEFFLKSISNRLFFSLSMLLIFSVATLFFILVSHFSGLSSSTLWMTQKIDNKYLNRIFLKKVK